MHFHKTERKSESLEKIFENLVAALLDKIYNELKERKLNLKPI